MFTYDADNRVVIADGQRVSGAVALSAGGVGITPSYENSYDAAGHVVSVESLGGTSGSDLMAQRFSYDLRGERTATWYALDLTAGPTDNGIQSTQSYDLAGHLLAATQYFIQGATAKYYQAGDAVWTTANKGTEGINSPVRELYGSLLSRRGRPRGRTVA